MEKGADEGYRVASDHRLMTEIETSESAVNVELREEEVKKELSGEVEENEENIESSSKPNTSEFLRELNLVLILSFLSLSAEQRLDLEEIKPKDVIRHPKPKRSLTPLRVFKQETKAYEFRALERQTQKCQTKIRDCRHCRRM